MLITISYSGPEPGDLGYLLHKHPAKVQSYDLSVGRAHVFYPEFSDGKCTAALMLELDALELVSKRHIRLGARKGLDHYVNDRPYVSSSIMSMAMGKVFRTAMTGRCDSRPDLAASPIPLEITLSTVPVHGEAGLPKRLFEPLGWKVTEHRLPLDPAFPEWGDSDYVNLTLAGCLRLRDALRQIYVLLPVIDDSKHYWVADDEVGKLLRAGEGWLSTHPARGFISNRYLAHQRSMTTQANLLMGNDQDAMNDKAAEADPQSRPLKVLRTEAVMGALHEERARSVVDMGCGEGALLKILFADPTISRIVGTDVSAQMLDRAEERLRLRELSERQQERLQLLQSSATYLDDRLRGYDAMVLMEVIEHIDLERLPALAAAVFGHARPKTVVVTSPNAEYNQLYPGLACGSFRHPDHRFEWSRSDFQQWASEQAALWNYTVEHRGVGEHDDKFGTPTQLALFRRA